MRNIRILERHKEYNNYLLFLCSLVFLIIFPIFSLLVRNSVSVFRLSYSLVIVFAAYTVTRSVRKLLIGIILGVLALCSYWGTELSSISETGFNILPNFFGIMFFSFIGLQLYHSLHSYQRIDLNVIYGAIIGYLLLGILGGQCCIFLTQVIPESFAHVNPNQSHYQYYYFSFVSLTTVGYGDITPVTDQARSLALLISLTGQIYLTVVIALIIGKFLARG